MAKTRSSTSGPRASTSLAKKSLKTTNGSRFESESSLTPISSANEAAEETHGIEYFLKGLSDGVTKLRREVAALQRQNVDLQVELDRIHEANDVSLQPKRGKRGGETMESLRAKVRKLTSNVVALERAREKDKRRIKQLRLKEIKEDAKDLEDELLHGIGDTTDSMRKLLRRFYDLMTTPSLEEDEECAICMEKLEGKNPTSLPCQHIFCRDCLSNVTRLADGPPNCPHCRTELPEDSSEMLPVEMTATQQWDALLEVAAEWAKIDKHGGSEPEETEEEDVPFIDDGDAENETSSAVVDAGVDYEEDPDPDPDGAALPSTPPPTEAAELPHTPRSAAQTQAASLSYNESPTAVKRRRLEELAQRRNMKRTRI